MFTASTVCEPSSRSGPPESPKQMPPLPCAGLAVSLMRGRLVIPYGVEPDLCPVLAWQDWEAAAGLTAGPAFRSVDRDVVRVGARQTVTAARTPVRIRMKRALREVRGE